MNMQDFAETILKNEKGLSEDQRELLRQIQDSDRYANCTIHDFAAENTESQWAAMTVDMNDGGNTSVLAMRGTDGTTLGWAEDLELLYSQGGTDAQRLSAQYLENSKAENIYMTGHSKGGSDVSSEYVMASEEARSRVRHIDNFDGPGMNSDFISAYGDGYKELSEKLTNYYPEDSVIGLLLNDNPGETYFILADVKDTYKDMGILGEHDPFAFVLGEDGRLEQTEQSGLSDFINKTLDSTVAELSQKERLSLVIALEKLGIPSLIARNNDNLFADNGDISKAVLQALYETGVIQEDDREKYQEPLRKVLSICEGVNIYKNMTDEEKEALAKTVALLIFHAAKEGIQEGIEAVQKNVEKILQKILDTYNKAAEIIYNKTRELADGLRELGKNVKEKVDSFWNGLFNWAEKQVEKATGRCTKKFGI